MTLDADSRLPGAAPTGALVSSITFWGFFGRCLLVWLGAILIVPAPWTSKAFYRFLCERTALPDGRRLKFAGQTRDIWYIFIALAIFFWLQRIQFEGLLSLLPGIAALANLGLSLMAFKWAVGSATTEDKSLDISFRGGLWAYIGWNILITLSIVTVIGWAWVLKFMLRWVCRNIRGNVAFEFTGTGLAILGRTLVLILLCTLVIPIPWAVRSYIRWYFSQVVVVGCNERPFC